LAIRGVLVECKGCYTQAVVPEGVSPHHPTDGLLCADPEASGCCTERHDHSQSGPDGQGGCRPVRFYPNAPVSLTDSGLQVIGVEA
jgi:hypothetical protein